MIYTIDDIHDIRYNYVVIANRYVALQRCGEQLRHHYGLHQFWYAILYALELLAITPNKVSW